MKSMLSLLLILPTILFSQSKYALIDKKLKQPILYTDSVTIEQVSKGYFPIENKNIDTFIANLQYLSGMLDKLQRAKMKRFELHSSNSIIKTERVPYAYGDRYNSEITSSSGDVTAIMQIIIVKKRIKKI